jgi:hypothetical protein
VKASQVRAAARSFFNPEHMALAVISPMKSDRALKRALSW